MLYLLAKFTLLFLLAALLGFVLGHWFSRRKFEDVSESFEDLRRANERSDEEQWNRLWEQLSAIPEPKETDLSGVLQCLDGVQIAVEKLPKPEPVDLDSIETRLDSLTEGVRSIPVPVMPKGVDIQPLADRIGDLEKVVEAIPAPEKTAPVDLEPLHTELSTVREDIKRMPVVETHAAVDLAPVSAQIESLQQGVNAISRPQTVDLKPIEQRLSSIETELGRVGKQLASSKAERSARRAPRKEERDELRVLSAALYGKKDDLKLISGVGPKLEKLLNSNGVYYFWQVAEWNKRDISIIDERLDTFRGRITRDNWVNQAKRLRREPSAAPMPRDA